MTWLSLLWNNRLVRSLAAILAAIAGVLAYGKAKERKGAQGAREAARQADTKRAASIEDKADEARKHTGGDPVERLRERGRLRD